MSHLSAKRLVDISLASIALLFTSPLFGALALLTKMHDDGPIFYRGERVGLRGKRFHILKFRTMSAHQSGSPTSTPADDPRITALGTQLRAYKLDELPQLINVLRGDMSLVGPRPQVPWAVERYSASDRIILTVRPGITDYASIVFRNESEILRGSLDPDGDYLKTIAPTKMTLARMYVQRHSVIEDVLILIATAWAVVAGNANGFVTWRTGVNLTNEQRKA